MNMKAFLVFYIIAGIILIVTAYVFIAHPIIEEIHSVGLKTIVESVWYGAGK